MPEGTSGKGDKPLFWSLGPAGFVPLFVPVTGTNEECLPQATALQKLAASI